MTRRGFIDHSDSLGATARYGGGDVQWMTAGKGIVHAEMFPLLDVNRPNPTELMQIWINLPRTRKFVDPYFSMFWSEQLPRVKEKDAQGREVQIEITAGDYGATKALPPPPHSWASDPQNHVVVWVIDLAPHAEWTLPASVAGLNRALYFFAGNKAEFGNKTVDVLHSLRLRSDAALPIRNGDQAARLLLLQGRPINEPVAQHGPFVMNTPQEIEQALHDLRTGRFIREEPRDT